MIAPWKGQAFEETKKTNPPGKRGSNREGQIRGIATFQLSRSQGKPKFEKSSSRRQTREKNRSAGEKRRLFGLGAKKKKLRGLQISRLSMQTKKGENEKKKEKRNSKENVGYPTCTERPNFGGQKCNKRREVLEWGPPFGGYIPYWIWTDLWRRKAEDRRGQRERRGKYLSGRGRGAENRSEKLKERDIIESRKRRPTESVRQTIHGTDGVKVAVEGSKGPCKEQTSND